MTAAELSEHPGGPPVRQLVTPLTNREFQLIANLAYRACGIELTESKRLMVWSRLIKKVRELGCSSFAEYYRLITEDRSGEMLRGMIDALTTNFTSFMREPAHFEFLRATIIPRLRGARQVRVWCAAAATGEEPYSIGISLLEEWETLQPAVISILATDISRRALEIASRGVYTTEKFRSLDPILLSKYFLKGTGGMRGRYRVKPVVRNLVTFRRLNLVERFPILGVFSVIFCRNVMIYFDRQTQQETVRRLVDCLEPGGYLLIGHSETLAGMDVALEYQRPAVYRKSESKRKSLGVR